MSTFLNYEPDYSEEDLQALVQEPRFLAAAQAYANGLTPLGWAYSFGFGSPRSLGNIPSPSALARLFHEAARRITIGTINPEENLWPNYSKCFDSFKQRRGYLKPTSLPLSGMYAELSQPRNYERYLKRRRVRYDESDFAEMVKNELVLACVDAFRRGLIDGFVACDRALAGELPRDLSHTAYALLQIEIARRIIDGRLVLPSDLEIRYPEAYRPNNQTRPA